MATCPVCGKEVNESKEFVIKEKKLVNLCSVCHSYLICLVKPVSVSARKNAQDWATEAVESNSNPYVREFVKSAYNFSLTEESEKNTNTFVTIGENETEIKNSPNSFSAPNQFEPQYSANIASVKISNTNIVKIMVILSYIVFTIGGVAVGGAINDDFAIIGGIIGLLVSLIANSVIMMFVEISENTAINARANLESKKLLEEIRDALKNSEK